MAVLFLFLSAQVGVVSLFEERRLGTLGRMLAGPVRPSNVLLGKTLGAFALGLVSMAVLVVATTSFIRADWAIACSALRPSWWGRPWPPSA